MAAPPLVALEIGTSKVCALVGIPREDDSILVVGIGSLPSCGVRKGEIIDLENAVVCVKSALHSAEESGHVTIKHIYLCLSGAHIACVKNRGTVPVMDVDKGITEDDIQEVMDTARAISLPHDRQIFHTITQKFAIDGQGGIINPEGMHGAGLSLDMLVLHGKRAFLENAVAVVGNSGVEVQDVVFSGLCSAMATLTVEQKSCGVLLIDMGAGTTEFVAYCDDSIAQAGVFAVGGDHVTNDIALAFNISQKRAERLKREVGGAIVDSSMEYNQVSVPPEVGFQACSIRMSDLNTVISLRIEETMELIRSRLEDNGLIHSLGAGVVLTGGCAMLKDCTALAEKVFGVPCVVGKPRNVTGVAKAYECPEYASAVGMLRHAFRSAESRSRGGLFDMIGQWIGR